MLCVVGNDVPWWETTSRTMYAMPRRKRCLQYLYEILSFSLDGSWLSEEHELNGAVLYPLLCVFCTLNIRLRNHTVLQTETSRSM